MTPSLGAEQNAGWEEESEEAVELLYATLLYELEDRGLDSELSEVIPLFVDEEGKLRSYDDAFSNAHSYCTKKDLDFDKLVAEADIVVEFDENETEEYTL